MTRRCRRHANNGTTYPRYNSNTTLYSKTLLVLCACLSLTWAKTSNTRTRNLKGFSQGPFDLIVLAGDQPQLLRTLFESISRTDFRGDEINLEIKVELGQEEVFSLADGFTFPDAIHKSVTTTTLGDSRTGSLHSWLDAWPEPLEEGSHALILDGNMQLSPSWYEYVKKSWEAYEDRPDLAGISLTRQSLTTSAWAPLRYLPIMNHNIPFLYGSVIGPAAFSPHPAKWREFLAWVKDLNLGDMRTTIPNIITTLIETKEFNEIFFYHTRKAGGTTIAKWLGRLAERDDMELHLIEGSVCPSQYFTPPKHPDRTAWLSDEGTLSLTVLRDPVERAISSYNFEGRWGKANAFKDMKEEDQKTLDEYIDETTSKENSCNNGQTCWKCTSNCFCHWFGGDGYGNCDEERSVDVLETFDMVLFAKDLMNPAFQRSLERLLNSVDTPMESRNVTPDKKKDAEFTEAQYRRLDEVNQIDYSIIERVTGFGRDKQVVQEWYNLLDEETMWTLWTQLFMFWCNLNNLSVLQVAPSDSTALAVSLSEELPPDFELADDTSIFAMRMPSDLNKYGLDGSLLVGEFISS